MNKEKCKCRLCGNDDIIHKYEIKDHSIYSCKNCNLIFIGELNIEPCEFYDQDYFCSETASKGYNNYKELESSLRKTFQKRISNIEKYYNIKDKKTTILDYGCGFGFFVDEVSKKGYDVKGFEISQYAAGYARENLKLDVRNIMNYPSNSFDLITLWDVIEHLENPLEILKNVNELLKDKGKIVITTGDISSILAKISDKKWHLLNIPEHICYFSPESMEFLLKNAGFKIDRIKYENSYYTVSYLIERLNKTIFNFKSKNSNSSFQQKIKNISLPVNLFDIMTVYATKQ